MKRAIALVAIGLLAAGGPASANILGTGSRAGNYESSTTSTWVTLPINGTATTVSFKTSAPNQTVRVTYNAECGALGNPGDWLAVQILIDGVAMAPNSGTQFALCTATSTSAFSWTGAVRQSTQVVPHSGTHQVTVQGYGVSTTEWWQGDTSIVIDQ